MTIKELAGILDGASYEDMLNGDYYDSIIESGLVVAYGFSDDLFEFEGKIEDEFGAYGGCTVLIKDKNIIDPTQYEDCKARGCPFYKKEVNRYKSITASWHNSGNPCWTVETDIPHETFNIYDDGEVFSVGIVFDIENT